MNPRWLVVVSSVALFAFAACQNDSSSGGTIADGGPGSDGGAPPPPPPAPPPAPPGAADGGGDGGSPAGCATTGYYAVQDGSPGARLYRVATSSAEHDVFIGALKTADGTPVFGFSAVAGVPGGGLVGFIGPNALKLVNSFVSIDVATAVVAPIGAPTDTSQTMTALSSAGATGLFLAAYANGEAACIDLPGSQFVGLLLKNIPPANEVLATGALHGTCSLDGSYDFHAIHHTGLGPSGYYLHMSRTGGGAAMIVEQSPMIMIPGGDGLVQSDSVTLNGPHLVKVSVDGTVTPIRDLDVSAPGSTGPACNQASSPGGFGSGALLAE